MSSSLAQFHPHSTSHTMATAQDIPLLIVSENSASERRISPSWTIAQLKGRLEPVTGVPATCQKLSLKIGSQAAQPIEAADEESTILAAWPLQAYAELKVGGMIPCFRSYICDMCSGIYVCVVASGITSIVRSPS